mgnify:CR=1 FL=1
MQPAQVPLWESDPALLPVIVASAMSAVVCVGLHGEAACQIRKWGGRSTLPTQVILPACVLILLSIHIVQVLVYALAHFVIEVMFGDRIGSLALADGSLVERIYFSAVVFSTLGFGDIVPVGPIRLLVAIESINGLMLIAWSATLTYTMLELEHDGWFKPRSRRKTRAGVGTKEHP